MPILIYVLAVLVTIFSSAYGIVALAMLAGGFATAVAFRHELRKIKLPSIDFWRTEP